MLLPVVLSVFTAILFGVTVTQADFSAYMLPAFASLFGALVWLTRRLRKWKPKAGLGLRLRNRRQEAAAHPTYNVSREKARPVVKPRRSKRRNPVIVDGSNVMHWKDGTPQADCLIAVIEKLKAMGYTPGVVFDANAGYRLAGEYRHDRELAESIGLDEDQVMVVNSGTPADPMILRMARELKAPIVSNDRFRDWIEDWPEVAEPSNFIRGNWQGDSVQLNRHSPQKGKARKKPVKAAATVQAA